MDLLLLFVVGWALRGAWQHVHGKLRDSREERIAETAKKYPQGMSKTQKRVTAARHDAGWWLREASHGFPVARTGWHAGWLSHKTAALHQKAIRDQARQQHEQVQGSLADAVKRQGQQNFTAVEAAIDGQPPDQAKATMGQLLKFPQRPQSPDQPEQEATDPAPEPGPYSPRDETARWLRAPMADPRPHCSACGHPPRPGDDLVPTPEGWHVHESHTTDPDSGLYQPARPADNSKGVTEVPTGTATAETTYSQDITKCQKIMIGCDVEGARLRAQQAQAWVEEMVTAGLDAKHTGMAADLSDQIEEQIKANQRVHDGAQALRDSIRRTHQAGHEYHSGAPDGGASREYLRD